MSGRVHTEVERVVVIGVAGAGKTTVAERLGPLLDAEVLDADAFHSAASVAKMASGQPLDEADRGPWLERLRDELHARSHVVLACSGLRRAHRDVLRRAGAVRFVYLAIDPDTAAARAAHRVGHFMGAGMIASQFAALEPPTADETDVVVVDAGADMANVVAAAFALIRE